MQQSTISQEHQCKVGAINQQHTDLKAVEMVADLLENVFSNTWSKEADLTSLSKGVAVTPEVCDDLLQAMQRERGQKASNDFVLSRCLGTHQGSCTPITNGVSK